MLVTVQRTRISSSGYPSLLRSIYSRTSRTLALILDFPPVGEESVFSQTRHFIPVEDFPNITCSFLHLGHLTFMNLLDGSVIIVTSCELNFLCPYAFCLYVHLAAFFAFKPKVKLLAYFLSSHLEFCYCWLGISS